MKRATVGISLMMILAIMFGFGSKVEAQNFDIEVSPAKVNISGVPGESVTQVFRVGNYSDADRVFSLSIKDFTVSSEEGSPKFLDKDEENDTSFSLRDWVTVPSQEIRVPSGSVREVEIVIQIPENAEPGGHYAAFFVQTEVPGDSDARTGVGAVGQIASLMLVTVPGDVVEELSVDDFRVSQKIYLESSPEIEIVTRILNTGNVHVIPTGALFIRGGINALDKTVIYNQAQGAVLPGAPARKISEKFVMDKDGFIPVMGRFEVDLVARAGLTGQEIIGHETFWIIPLKFLAVVSGLVLVALFLLWRVVVSFR